MTEVYLEYKLVKHQLENFYWDQSLTLSREKQRCYHFVPERCMRWSNLNSCLVFNYCFSCKSFFFHENLVQWHEICFQNHIFAKNLWHYPGHWWIYREHVLIHFSSFPFSLFFGGICQTVNSLGPMYPLMWEIKFFFCFLWYPCFWSKMANEDRAWYCLTLSPGQL